MRRGTKKPKRKIIPKETRSGGNSKEIRMRAIESKSEADLS